MSSLTLFGTDGCHLCEEAEALLRGLHLSFESIDICDNEEHAARYGVTIPVLRREDGGELNWPFDQAAVTDFLELK